MQSLARRRKKNMRAHTASLPLARLVYLSFLVAARASRIVAIGDLHGDVTCAMHWIRRTQLVNNFSSARESWRWRDPSAHLIFMGDYIYAISLGGITVTNLTSMENSDEIEFSDYIEDEINSNDKPETVAVVEGENG